MNHKEEEYLALNLSQKFQLNIWVFEISDAWEISFGNWGVVQVVEMLLLLVSNRVNINNIIVGCKRWP